MQHIAAKQFDEILKTELADLLEEIGDDAKNFVRRAVNLFEETLTAADARFEAGQPIDWKWLYDHGRARIDQLMAISLLNVKERFRDRIASVVFAVFQTMTRFLAQGFELSAAFRDLAPGSPGVQPLPNPGAPDWLKKALRPR